MASLETTELKLKTTPTGGVSGEHSPYYRRLLSAGYKGFLQGTIGGAGLYGLMGGIVGTLIAIPTFFAVGPLAFGLIPAMAGVGVIKGANTFGNIGTVAAITAESADLTEQRRYLLDRYYDLPDTPDGNKQADAIAQQLSKQFSSGQHHNMFHWRTVAICAAVGAGLALLFLVPGSPLAVGAVLEHTALGTALHAISEPLLAHFGGTMLSSAVIHAGVSAAFGTAIGAAAGATVGLDRYYVRKWFDHTEKLLHDDSHSWNAMQERSRMVELLKAAAKEDEETKRILERQSELHQNNEKIPALPSTFPEKITPQPIANLDKPETKISAATLQNRLIDLQKALDMPTV